MMVAVAVAVAVNAGALERADGPCREGGWSLQRRRRGWKWPMWKEVVSGAETVVAIALSVHAVALVART